MHATRATAVTADGGVFGATTETPPEDPPPDDSRVVWALVLHILIHVVIHIAKTDYNHENNFQFNPQVDRIRMDADRFRDTQAPRSINYVEPFNRK
jgi:hypothetical protein